jgi:Cu2+-exporting ATPase
VQVVAAGALFKRAVLLNAGDALERMAQVDTVVFDKTGTLTLPEPELLNAAAIDATLLAQAGALALSSRHPLAKAVAAASNAKTPLPDVKEVTGQGVEATIGGVAMRLGSPLFCRAQLEAAAVAASHPDASLIAFRSGDKVTVFAVAQKLRPDAIDTIADLRARGLDVHILSGDRQGPVSEAAATLGIKAIRAEAKPADKTAYLEALKAKGHKVLMVGDGINDAPALAMADVSLSPVTAADLTQAAADAVFLGERLAPVNDAVGLSRKARSIMAQNLWFSVLYNAVAVPIAIAGYATPLIAALAMSGSSIIVVLNALRARQAS